MAGSTPKKASSRSSSSGGARSASRGRALAKTPKSTKKAAKTPAKVKMEFSEGDNVMARWPGTSLYFKAKVTFVREDDGEYDVQYEDGTIFTIKSKDVRTGGTMSATATRKKTPSRSRSRGRSPARKTKATPKATPKSASPKKRTSRSTASSSAVKAPRPDATPTRQSRRLAEKKVAVSDDEDSGRKAIPNPAHPKRGAKRSFFANFNLDWMKTLFFAALGPLILLSLHQLCKNGSCKPAYPSLSRNWAHYWNKQAFIGFCVFLAVMRLFSLMPLGNRVRSASGKEVRLNGFFTLLAMLAVVPVMVYRKMSFAFVADNYYHLMTSAVLFSMYASTAAYVMARWGKRSNANPKGNTGNFIVDFCNGREFNPHFFHADFKLQAFRFSMVGLALLNVCLVVNSINAKSGAVNPAVVVAAAFQVIYAADAMFFEEYYFFSHDAMNSGFGFSLISSYMTFPFLPTLITQYMIAKQPVLPAFQLGVAVAMNVLGYIVFRASETQRCEFTKSPHSAAVRHLETLSTVAGRKLLCSGWWGCVRYPNYLGEALIQWSWVLPAVSSAGRVDLLIYYLPVFTTLMLLARCSSENAKNKRKYGSAWDKYCERVPANILPKIY